MRVESNAVPRIRKNEDIKKKEKGKKYSRYT